MFQSNASENLQKNVRKYIFEHFEEYTTPPVLEQIMRKFGLDRTSAFKVLADLQSARHIALLTGTQRILMPFPFSSVVTPFRVKVAGKEKGILRIARGTRSLFTWLLEGIHCSLPTVTIARKTSRYTTKTKE